MTFTVHPVYDMRVGLDRDRVRQMLGKPAQIRPIASGRELWLYANNPKMHFVAVTFEAGRLDHMELRLDHDPEETPVIVMNLGEMGFTTSMSMYAGAAAASLLMQIELVDETRVRNLHNRAEGVVSVRTEPPGTALKHLAGILDRGLELPGVRSHIINPRVDRTGVEVLTRIGADVASVRDDRISYMWRLLDERIVVMEVGV
ncbi:hypothetical protein ABZ454_35520 [Streptomyces sp. NPDC005803]|uniref:hypothetical protein n=1 Tax=Streptomyces sp. NPDC005803 TaxID=3154297 RepID=UPI0033E6BB77